MSGNGTGEKAKSTGAASIVQAFRKAPTVIGVFAMMAIAVGLLVVLVLSALDARASYFERRSLLELDRFGTELSATAQTLGAAAALHFVPDQMHFSVTEELECLMATTTLGAGTAQEMSIAYYFGEPNSATKAAKEDPASTASERSGSEDPCNYGRPLGHAWKGVNVQIKGDKVTLEQTMLLKKLLWPITARGPAAGSGSDLGCLPESGLSIRDYVRLCFLRAAQEDLDQERGFTGRPADRLRGDGLKQLMDTAFDNNVIRVNVTTGTEALKPDRALELFDAVQVHVWNTERKAYEVVYQAGRLPTLSIAAEEYDPGRVWQIVPGTGQPVAAAPAARDAGLATGVGNPLVETDVQRTQDLLLFRQTTTGISGMQCSASQPCLLLGIVGKSRFDRMVRKLDGIQATWLLIGVLSFIGFIPLVHLGLSRRLDSIGNAAQYGMWFSLTLLAASAAIGSFAIWSSAASRGAGQQYADEAIGVMKNRFYNELDDTLELVRRVGEELPRSTAPFPSPELLPSRTQPGEERVAKPLAEQILDEANAETNDAAILDTVSYFRSDGFVDNRTARFAAGRFPSFGTAVGDRSYFQRALRRDFDTTEVHCGLPDKINARRPDGSDGAERTRPPPDRMKVSFLLDRVFARPDGAARTIVVLPHAVPTGHDTFKPCPSLATGLSKLDMPAPATRAETEGPAHTEGVAETVTVLAEGAGESLRFASDEIGVYDPTTRNVLLASATLRTFVNAQLKPGLEYAVIDPARPRDEPDVLFHSRKDAELVDRFSRDIDDPAKFQAIVNDLIFGHPGQDGTIRLDTRYRTDPSILNVSRLHPDLDWVLVVIESRNDAGFSVWRAATFGYSAWLFGGLLLLIPSAIARFRSPKALDRRPGLWLWPQGRLDDFTPIRFAADERHREALKWAAERRNTHMSVLLLAAVVGIPSAEAAARIFFALAIAATAFAARSYFRGETAEDPKRARRLDRSSIFMAAVLLAFAVALFPWALFAAEGIAEEWWWWVRGFLFVCATLVVAERLLNAFRNSADDPPERKAAGGGRFAKWGWLTALLLMGAGPAVAGYLDSYDHDRFLIAERDKQLGEGNRRALAEAIDAIDIPRQAKLSVPVREALSKATPIGAPGDDPPSEPIAVSALAMNLLGLHETAVESSDLHPYQMRTAVCAPSAWPFRAPLLFATVLLPVAALILALMFFRSQYFRPTPVVPFGKDQSFDPPLSLTRGDLDLLLKSAGGGNTPAGLPFTPIDDSKLVLLGVDLHLRGEFESEHPELASQVRWIDVLHFQPAAAAPELSPETKLVVIGNLDLALELTGIEGTMQILGSIEAILEEVNKRKIRAVLLAEIDPLDRIALLRSRHRGAKSGDARVESRWAEMLGDFTLYPVTIDRKRLEAQTDDPELLHVAERELSVVGNGFADRLLDTLAGHFRKPSDPERRPTPAELKDENRFVAYLTQQLSDHYYRIWSSSSDEERVILYRTARGAHMKMDDSRAVRSLLARGLLVRMPEYRLMNESFTRYVRRVETASLVRSPEGLTSGVDTVWPLLRYPLYATAAALLILLQFAAPPGASGALGALPALMAAMPTLLSRWVQNKVAVG